jgi:hypothetical protein
VYTLTRAATHAGVLLGTAANMSLERACCSTSWKDRGFRTSLHDPITGASSPQGRPLWIADKARREELIDPG